MDTGEYTRYWYTWIAERRAQGPPYYRGPVGAVRNASFLEGDCGAAVALFHLASGTVPIWEELLLMARPTRG